MSPAHPPGRREAPISTRPILSDDDWAPYGERLTRVGEHLAARGVAMAYHHHMGTMIETETEIDPAKAHPPTYARIGHEGVTRAVAAAGSSAVSSSTAQSLASVQSLRCN